MTTRLAGLDEIRLAPEEVERRRLERDRHYHVHIIPVLRFQGMALLALIVAIHNLYVLRSFSARPYLTWLALLAAYCLGSWLLLRAFYSPRPTPTLGDVFLVGDIVVLIAALYVSGGERSWLLPVLIARVADQAHSTYTRVRFFAHAIVAAYGLLLLYLLHVDHHSLDWQAELAKLGALYAVSLYIASTARTAEHLRQRSAAAVVMARALITELETNRERLELERSRAEEASAFKSAFLANMSHEVRTPLNGIMGMSDLALSSNPDPQLRDYLETIQSSARALLRIVNDVLDFSRIETGQFDFELTPFGLRDWLAEVARSSEPLARNKQLEFSCVVAPDVPDRLLGDPGRLRQVLVNLVGNAVKFTATGSVQVGISLEQAGEREVVLGFAVTDTGIGVPPEKRAVIFDAFTQADGSLTRRYGGTGLGLSISLRLVTHMSGRLWLESPPEGGSRFRFTVRLQRAAPTEAVALDLGVWRGRRVLVAAELPAAAELWRTILAGAGAQVTTAALGRPTVLALERYLAAGLPFSLVVLDTDGTDFDTLAIASRIRGNPALGQPAIVIALAAGERGDAARCREIGIGAYLRKPLSGGELLAAATQSLAANTTASRPDSTARAARQSLRILLAEDNAVNVKVAVSLLERWGHTVTVANDGVSAVDRLERGRFDLALLDVQMPGMTGPEVAQQVRAAESGGAHPLPLIALTAHALAADRERCFAAGMNAYVTKPIDPAELFDTIERLGAGEPVDGISAVEAGPEVSAADLALPFDREVALARLGGDEALLVELGQLLLDDLAQLPPRLRAALRSRDPAAVHSVAHQLKGSLATFAAEPGRALAERMELTAESGNFDTLEADFAELEDQLGLLRQALHDQLDIAPNEPGGA